MHASIPAASTAATGCRAQRMEGGIHSSGTSQPTPGSTHGIWRRGLRRRGLWWLRWRRWVWWIRRWRLWRLWGRWLRWRLWWWGNSPTARQWVSTSPHAFCESIPHHAAADPTHVSLASGAAWHCSSASLRREASRCDWMHRPVVGIPAVWRICECEAGMPGAPQQGRCGASLCVLHHRCIPRSPPAGSLVLKATCGGCAGSARAQSAIRSGRALPGTSRCPACRRPPTQRLPLLTPGLPLPFSKQYIGGIRECALDLEIKPGASSGRLAGAQGVLRVR